MFAQTKIGLGSGIIGEQFPEGGEPGKGNLFLQAQILDHLSECPPVIAHAAVGADQDQAAIRPVSLLKEIKDPNQVLDFFLRSHASHMEDIDPAVGQVLFYRFLRGQVVVLKIQKNGQDAVFLNRPFPAPAG